MKHMDAVEILERLKARADPAAVAGMARFGINPKNTYGVSMPALRRIARESGGSHSLALELWQSGIHEARIIAALIDVPDRVTGKQMDIWANDFDSWDVCDQCCSNLFAKTKVAYEKASKWSSARKEFVKRAGFALMAALAVHDKEANNSQFLKFLELIEKEAADERNFVKKSVNWALRQIGKRNLALNKAAVRIAKAIRKMDSKSARWIGSDALRELTNATIQKRLRS